MEGVAADGHISAVTSWSCCYTQKKKKKELRQNVFYDDAYFKATYLLFHGRIAINIGIVDVGSIGLYRRYRF